MRIVIKSRKIVIDVTSIGLFDHPRNNGSCANTTFDNNAYALRM